MASRVSRADGVAVGVRAPGEDFVETFEEPAEQAVDHALKPILLRAAGPEEERGERGRKGERVERGDRSRDRNGERELPEKLAGDSRHECGRDKNRRKAPAQWRLMRR